MDALLAVFRPAAAASALLAAFAGPGFAQVVAVPAALLNHAEGSVAVAPKGDNEWIDVKPRRVLRRGDRLWTDKGARAEVQAGGHLLRLDSQSQVALDAVSDSAAQVSLLRGSLAVSVTKLGAGENVEVGTPNLALRARQAGDYRVDVDPQQGTTRVSVMSGSVVVYGEHGESVDVGAGQRLTFRERTLAKAATPAFTAVDDFDRWMVARGKAPAAEAPQMAIKVHPDVIARMHREQEAARQAQVRRELEELKQAQAQAKQLPAAKAAAPAPAAAPKIAQGPAPAAAPAPRIVQAPAAPPARIVKVPAPPAAPDARAVAAAKREQEQRRAAQAQARRADEERKQASARKAEEARRAHAAAAAAVAAKREQERRRVASAKKAEEERKQAIARRAEQERRVAQARRAQEQAIKAAAHQQAVGEARKAQLAKLQQQAMREELAAREQREQRELRAKQEQARREEVAKREEEARRDEEARREAWERRQRALAEQQKRDHEVWLRTQQPIQVQPYRPAPQGVPARRVS